MTGVQAILNSCTNQREGRYNSLCFLPLMCHFSGSCIAERSFYIFNKAFGFEDCLDHKE